MRCFAHYLRHLRNFRLALLTMAPAIGLSLSPPAQAATAWLCNLSEDAVRLVCVADVDPLDEPAAAPAAATATVKGTRFPLDPRRIYTVDLWSPPTEPEWVELLARSTICYRSPGCTVTMAPNRWSVSAMPRPRWAQVR
jgi:hypothetical protein